MLRRGCRRLDRHVRNRSERRGKPYYWLGFNRDLSEPEKGTDLWARREGHISVTPLHLNPIHVETCRKPMRDLER